MGPGSTSGSGRGDEPRPAPGSGNDPADVDWADLEEGTVEGADDFGWRYVYWGQLLFGLLVGAVGWLIADHVLAGGDVRAIFPQILVMVGAVFVFGVYLNNLHQDAPLADYSRSCHHCGGPTNRYSEFCEHCGADLVYEVPTRACPGCGEEVAADVPFCHLCGTEVAGPDDEARG